MSDENTVFIGLSTVPGDVLSWIIRRVTKSKHSHTWYLYGSVLWGGKWLAHADEKGVRKIPAEGKLLEEWKVNAVYKVKGDVAPGLQSIRGYIGKPYDFWALIGFLLRWLVWMITFKKIGNPIRSASKLVCSEFVAMGLKAADFPDTMSWDVESMIPQDVENYMVSKPNLFEKMDNLPG